MKNNFKNFKNDWKKYNKKYDRIAKKADARVATIYEERSRKVNREAKRFNKKHPAFAKIVLAALLVIFALPFGILYIIDQVEENKRIENRVNRSYTNYAK